MALVVAAHSADSLVDSEPLPKEMRTLMQCEVEQLSAPEKCANEASYAITISYLGHPALALHLCKVHILDTWHLAQQGSIPLYGNDGHIKSVAVKKLEVANPLLKVL
ncbi:MAG: hypothetical protein DMG61_20820 [Acidobacteria bacterium]|nr:MAG: hypothetical protein DMG61_20820 [Acidobacteriota bacterium]PYY16371.1 MAG: hypothetical protein DMG60_15260 [Acidobacteriota bacterium]